MIAGQGGAGQKSLDTARAAAIAAWARALVVQRPGQGVMAPFAGHGVQPGDGPAVQGDAAADAGAQDHPEHHGGALGGAVGGFGQGKTVGVVGQAHGPAQGGFQVPVERMADQPGRIGILDQAGGRGEGAGDADADMRDRRTCRRLQAIDQAANGFNGGVVVALWRGNAAARGDRPGVVQHQAFDLGAAKVNSGAHDRREN